MSDDKRESATGKSNSPYVHYESPTQLWLSRREDNAIKDDASSWRRNWTEQCLRIMPVDEYIALERKHAESHVSVCHATMKENYALDLFVRAISPPEDSGIVWVRSFNRCPQSIAKSPFNADRTIRDILDVKARLSTEVSSSSFKSGAVDNTAFMAWHLLSCSPSLFQNSDKDSMESAADYYYGNGQTSVTPLDFNSIIHDILDTRNLLMRDSDARNTLIAIFQEMSSASQSGEFGLQNVLYQYLIPHELVNTLLYVSHKNGIVDAENDHPLNTLCLLKTRHAFESVSNHDELQVRLFVPQLLTPAIARQLIVVTHERIENCELFFQFIARMVNVVTKEPNIVVTKNIKDRISALKSAGNEPEVAPEIAPGK